MKLGHADLLISFIQVTTDSLTETVFTKIKFVEHYQRQPKKFSNTNAEAKFSFKILIEVYQKQSKVSTWLVPDLWHFLNNKITMILLLPLLEHHLKRKNFYAVQPLQEETVNNILVSAEIESTPVKTYKKRILMEFPKKLGILNSYKTMLAILKDDKWQDSLELLWQTVLIIQLKRSGGTTIISLCHTEVTPAILPWKIFCQKIWMENLNWSTNVFRQFENQFTRQKGNWKPMSWIVTELGIKRYSPLEIQRFILVLQLGYKLNNYAGRWSDNNTITLPFVKKWQIRIDHLVVPKREFLGTFIASSTLSSFKEGLKTMHTQCFAWTNSKCALTWLKSKQVNFLSHLTKNQMMGTKQEIVNNKSGILEENLANQSSRTAKLIKLIVSRLVYCGAISEMDTTLKKKNERAIQSHTLIRRNTWIWFSVLLLLTFTRIQALIGYDCGHTNLNITSIDATRVAPCKIENKPPVITKREIQLIQLADSYPVEIIQCKVIVKRHITNCGMFSHASEVLGGYVTFLTQIGEAQCKELHKTKSLQVQGNVWFRDLEPEKVHVRTAILAGSLSITGKCSGGSYADAYGSWEGVVVQASYTILTSRYSTVAYPGSDEIKLKSQLTCKYSTGSCMDLDQGETFWEVSPQEACSRDTHIVLYQGMADIITSRDIDDFGQQTVTYSVEAGQKIFALRRTKAYKACAFSMFKTEHPKLVVAHPSAGGFYFKITTTPSSSFDLLTYMNTKFVYIDKTMGRNLEELHRRLSFQRCQSERKTLLTLLAVAATDANEFAYAFTEKPGYTAYFMGEVIHLIQCVPVEVSIRTTERCYTEIPVTWNNQSVYLTPKTRLLKIHGTEVTCNDFMQPMYRLNNDWYSLTPRPVRTQAPTVLEPEKSGIYRYLSPRALASGGIYDETEIEKLRDEIMYHNGRSAVTNVLTRGATGRKPDLQGISMSGTFDDFTVDKLKEGIISKVLSGLNTIGHFVSTGLGILLILQILKWLIDTFLHGKILYELYGLSTVLLGAILNSITAYFVYRRTTTLPKATSATNSHCHGTQRQGEGETVNESRIPLSQDPTSTSFIQRSTSVPSRISEDNMATRGINLQVYPRH